MFTAHDPWFTTESRDVFRLPPSETRLLTLDLITVDLDEERPLPPITPLPLGTGVGDQDWTKLATPWLTI
jgi:hypothetical protein